jgi:hypothetical protein
MQITCVHALLGSDARDSIPAEGVISLQRRAQPNLHKAVLPDRS